MLLSIIVISHNKRDLLKRCIDSILEQYIPFEYEIIISDDASSDGSWELALEYQSRYSGIKAYQCNTDDYNPANRSERSGWNRCNGYKHATGKYIAHIDGDDFLLKGTDIYKKQVELLESHPECSCCMANDHVLKDGDDLSRSILKHKECFETGQILSSEKYIRKYFRESHCFVYRRNSDVDPVKLYGGYYVDTMITDHHLQFGNIVCLNDAGYVYVQYNASIWNENRKSQDHKVLTHALYIPLLIPKWKYEFLSDRRHLKRLLNVVKLAISKYKLKEENLKWISRFDRYLYSVFNRDLKFSDKMHLAALYILLGTLIVFQPSIKFPYKLLNKML